MKWKETDIIIAKFFCSFAHFICDLQIYLYIYIFWNFGVLRFFFLFSLNYVQSYFFLSSFFGFFPNSMFGQFFSIKKSNLNMHLSQKFLAARMWASAHIKLSCVRSMTGIVICINSRNFCHCVTTIINNTNRIPLTKIIIIWIKCMTTIMILWAHTLYRRKKT